MSDDRVHIHVCMYMHSECVDEDIKTHTTFLPQNNVMCKTHTDTDTDRHMV